MLRLYRKAVGLTFGSFLVGAHSIHLYSILGEKCKEREFELSFSFSTKNQIFVRRISALFHRR